MFQQNGITMRTFIVETIGLVNDTFEVYAVNEEDAVDKVVDSLSVDRQEAFEGICFSISAK